MGEVDDAGYTKMIEGPEATRNREQALASPVTNWTK
jgi:hypothetical protein